MTRRATARGAERTSLDGARADVLVCGASFAGLAVARELAGAGADVLLVDRYEIGERATSACAAPTPWLHAMGVEGSIRQEIPCMRFTTPHGSCRYRLPWSWSAFDYRDLCLRLFDQCGDARFETVKVEGRTAGGVQTDRGELLAPLVVDGLGWRRVLAEPHYQPPEAPLSRGLEVHPPAGGGSGGSDLEGSDQGSDPDGSDPPLDVWIDRSLVRRGYAWRVPAGEEARIGVGSYDPRRHVREPTEDLAGRLDTEAVRWQGNWFPHRLRAAADGQTFFAGDSAGHCFPLSGEGIRTAFYFGIAAGREIRAVLAGERPRSEALARYGAFSDRHAPAFRRALRLQRLVPRLPPRVLTAALRALSAQPFVDRAFGWYLDQAHPAHATPDLQSGGRWMTPRSPTTNGDSSRASSRTRARARS
jgi:flavin-dependent dehydrogenase